MQKHLLHQVVKAFFDLLTKISLSNPHFQKDQITASPSSDKYPIKVIVFQLFMLDYI